MPQKLTKQTSLGLALPPRAGAEESVASPAAKPSEKIFSLTIYEIFATINLVVIKNNKTTDEYLICDYLSRRSSN